MALTVYKYQWPDGLPPLCDFAMPKNAEILLIGSQFKNLCIWARVDLSLGYETRKFNIVGTGQPAPEGKYLGTAHMDNGHLVLHVFELGTEGN